MPPGCRRCKEKRKATPGASISRDAAGPRAVRDPVHVRKHLAREPGDPVSAQRRMTPWAASGSPRTYADDARTREVGQARSTREVPEQRRATGRGGDGGKGSGQREPAPAKPAYRTQGRDWRAQCAGAGTSSSRQGQEDAVHGAPAPRLRPRHAASGLFSSQEEMRLQVWTGRHGGTTARHWRRTSKTSPLG